MVRFKDVKIDPWLQRQEKYRDYKKIPEDATFACSYFVFMNPIETVESAFLRRTKKKDELWVASWNYEFSGDLTDYSKREQFDSFGCTVVAPRHGKENTASQILLEHLFRSRVGFLWPTHFIQSGIVTEAQFKGIIEKLKTELNNYAQIARENRSKIVDVAEELGLRPEPTGLGPYEWVARCPGTSHHIYISTKTDSFGCGYCRRKGGPNELRSFVKERRSKNRNSSQAEDSTLDIKKAALKIQNSIVRWRRDLHQIPELSFELHLTSQYVKQQLDKMDISYNTIAQTGIVAIIEGDSYGPTIALRADMDALKIKEETGLGFASTNGNMHACGHDAHMAMLLGAAKIISDHKDKLNGKVKLLFQPAEEAEGGAEPMIQEGCLENPDTDAILALHIGHMFPEVGMGQIGIGYGPVMAAVSVFSVTVKGKSAHVGTPHYGIDAITTASEMILALQKIISRELDPTSPVALTIAQINGGNAFNVISDEVIFKGDLRTVNKKEETVIKQRIEEICQAVAKSNRAEVEVEFIKDFPATVNNESVTREFVKSAQKIVGEENIIGIIKPSMGNEDMSFFLEKVPGTYFFLGSFNPDKGEMYPHHHPKFDIEEGILWVGSAVFAQAVFDLCRSFPISR
jgi:amidohydrolase